MSLLVSAPLAAADELAELPDLAVTTTGAIAAPGTSTTVSADIVNHGAPTITQVLRAGTPIHLEFPLAVTTRAHIAGPVYASVIVGLPRETGAITG